ncbi:hypothetical protein QFZ83_001724 [Variovorax sp. W1I1]|nr:hypothetical protein [Variovorax sp. W1I1]
MRPKTVPFLFMQRSPAGRHVSPACGGSILCPQVLKPGLSSLTLTVRSTTKHIGCRLERLKLRGPPRDGRSTGNSRPRADLRHCCRILSRSHPNGETGNGKPRKWKSKEKKMIDLLLPYIALTLLISSVISGIVAVLSRISHADGNLAGPVPYGQSLPLPCRDTSWSSDQKRARSQEQICSLAFHCGCLRSGVRRNDRFSCSSWLTTRDPQED